MRPCDNCAKLNPTSIAVLLSLLISVAVAGGIEPQDATAQSPLEALSQMGGTGTQNQTQMTPETQNQTQMAPVTQNQTRTLLGNLTRADMEPVTGALNSTRDSLLGDNSQEAYTFLNDADDALFRIAQDKGPSAATTIIKITEPTRSHIESAQQALLVNDLPKALDERNSAEVELVRIIQGLPAEEEEPPAEEEEPPAEEEEPPEDEE